MLLEKKKIIFVNNNLKVGGVQISLMNLLKGIHNLYDVTLLLFRAEPKDIAQIPSGVNVITINSPFKYLGMSQKEARSSWRTFLGRAFWAAITKLFGRSVAVQFMSPFQKKIQGYDCAISYLHEGNQKSFYGGCNDFVLKKIDAKKKIAWLHCDYERCGANNSHSQRIYGQFDKIVACSKGVKKVFIKCLPELQDRCVAIRNCNDYDTIKSVAYPGIEYEKDCFNIVTVARLSAEKGIDRMLRAVARVKEKGGNIKYHVVGFGQEWKKLHVLTEELGIQEDVIFYGNKKNPYPYIASADLFVLPSLHEAAPMVFDEAACLGIPVLATKTTSTDEMIEESGAGFVCENSQDGITEALLEILANPESLYRVKDALGRHHYSNKKILKQMEELLFM